MINNEMQSMPYFMQNKEWYYFDEENFCYKLTDKAPPKAIGSYKEFYDDEPIEIDGEWYNIQK